MSAAQREFKAPRAGGGIWNSLNRFLFMLIIVTILMTVGYKMLPELGKRREHEARAEQLQALVDEEKQKLAMNLRIENLLRHDPSYIEMIARDRLDLADPRETIYRLEGTKSGR